LEIPSGFHSGIPSGIPGELFATEFPKDFIGKSQALVPRKIRKDSPRGFLKDFLG